ncbi:pleckstrin homology domain-containing family O member 1-A isoform X2 [Salvelinus fontinalis]|uniref:pleckstrin homology domain-containing family O member 1-A isoform X2 n=1 Tax=Salvelinus fontinalis TaxID=8038 RepID=UPI002486275E|nr:pleckstrin homology domain-containing family O member 1-A isoform X2 [Salvelinus fontinalis]XP_055750242.1 pleckstrin homology domain-containing family O member 1-A isoform X2 [Salvelinus fontinalis]
MRGKSRSCLTWLTTNALRSCARPRAAVPNLVFLAVSPEEKESWVNALNTAIIKAKNRIFDEVTIEEDSVLVHPTRDRAKIPHARRLPTRGHLMAVASTSSDGMLTLDLVHEEDDSTPEDEEEGFWENNFRVDLYKWTTGRQRSGTDVSKLCVTTKDLKVPKTSSLPRGSELSWDRAHHLEAQSHTPPPGKRFSAQGRSRCASMDEVLSLRPVRGVLPPRPIGEPVQPVGPLQSLIAQKMQRAQELLEEMRLEELQRAKGLDSPYLKGIDSPRLYHLRGSESPHSRASGSPRSKSSDSPRLRGKDSPRTKGKKSRSKGTDSPHSKRADSPNLRGNNSPRLRVTDSPCMKGLDSSSFKETDSPSLKGSDSPRLKNIGSPFSKSFDSSSLKGSDSPRIKDTILRGKDSPNIIGKNSPSLKSIGSPSLKGADSPHADSLHSKSAHSLLSDFDLESRRAEAERLLQEAVSSWRQAKEVLEEVKELQTQSLNRRSEKKTTDRPPTPPPDYRLEDACLCRHHS